MSRVKGPRKLLVASVGVATINYVLASTGCSSTVANLPAPQPTAGSAGTAGAAGASAGTAGTTTGGTSGGFGFGGGGSPTVANLPAPIIGGQRATPSK